MNSNLLLHVLHVILTSITERSRAVLCDGRALLLHEHAIFRITHILVQVFRTARISLAMISKYFKYTSNCFEVLLHVIHILTSIIESGRAIPCGGTALLLREVPIRQVAHILASSIWSSRNLSCHGIQRLQVGFASLRGNTSRTTYPCFNY